jgi:hypothetical protein
MELRGLRRARTSAARAKGADPRGVAAFSPAELEVRVGESLERRRGAPGSPRRKERGERGGGGA